MNSEAKLFWLPARTFSKAAAGSVLLLASFVLLGWLTNTDIFIRGFPGLPPMNPVTAVCILLAAAALFCVQDNPSGGGNRLVINIGRACIGILGFLVIFKLAGELFHWKFQIDRLLFDGKWPMYDGDSWPPMSPNTAINFLIYGGAVFYLDFRTRRGHWPAQYLIIAVILLAWLTLVGYVFNSSFSFSPTHYVPMAVHTAAAFILLGLGVLAARPDRGIIAVWLSDEEGGKITRRLLPVAILVPSLLGGFKMLNGRISLFGVDFGISLMVLTGIAVSVAIICNTAFSLNEVDRERRRAEKGLRDSERRFHSIWESSVDGMRLTDSEGIIIDVNPAFCELAGMESHDLIGKPMSELYHEDENPRRRLQRYKERFRAGMIDKNRERRIKFRSGKEVDLEFSVSFVEVEGGKPLLLSVFRDISQRKMAEARIRSLNDELEKRVAVRTAELTESERRSRFLAESMPQIIWTAQPDGNLDYFNQRWFDYTGMTFEQTRDVGWRSVVHPDDLEICDEKWTRALELGENCEVEYRFRRAVDGVYRWHLGRAFALKNDKGEITQWVGTCVDIEDLKRAEDEVRKLNADLERRVEERTTALAQANEALEKDNEIRQQAEASLARLKAKLEAILDAATQVSIIATDIDGSITMFNSGAGRMFGYNEHEVVGKVTLEKLHLPEEVQNRGRELSEELGVPVGGFEVFVAQARRIGYDEREWTCVRKDGGHVTVSLVVTPLLEEDGSIIGFLGIAKDITLRNEMEEELRASMARFRALSASSPIGIFQTDVEGNCLYANAQWLLKAGMRADEAMGTGWVRAIYAPDRDATLKEWMDCAREGREFTREFRIQTPEGIVRWIRSRAAAIMTGGKVSGYVGTTEDITERKSAEEQLQRFAADLEKSNGELKDALANVKTLRGLLPICSGCKKIRDDQGYWNQIEFFIRDHSDANFSHGMCPECSKQFFPGFAVSKNGHGS